jgi:hypothetical protein
VQRIRKSIRALRKVLPTARRPLTELILVATGDVVLAFRNGTAFDAISGQEWVFEVAQFQRELDSWKQSIGTPRTPHRSRVAPGKTARERTA